MRHVTLTQVEATDIQDYIFGSNNLSQNVGASELVARATGCWVVEVLDGLKLRRNASCNELDEVELSDQASADGGLQAEVIYAAGGSALVLFEGPAMDAAQEFAAAISRKAIDEARGLNLLVGHETFDWDSKLLEDSLSQRHRNLRKKMRERKLSRMHDLPLPGLSVTASCVFSGLPATGHDDDGRLISMHVRHKLNASVGAQERLKRMLPQVNEERLEFVRDFDLFGEKNESTYIAVVHTDGNDMSERFRSISDAHLHPDKNSAYIKQLRSLSRKVHENATHALCATVNFLLDSREKDPEDGEQKFGGVVPIPKKDKVSFLPFRPLVFGGDDSTFVCEGRLGLALAVRYLEALGEGELPGAKEGQHGGRLYARAGVAVVKSHYPFSRAYELAEALCRSAKRKIEDLYLSPDGKGTVIDWHFSTGGVVRTLEEVRGREYVADNGHSLLMRPLRIDLDGAPAGSRYWRSWENFSNIIGEFRKPGWSSRRNKVFALRRALRRGSEAVKLFRKNYDQDALPEVPGQTTMATTGWQADDCGYFDAVEALDFYVPLTKKENRS